MIALLTISQQGGEGLENFKGKTVTTPSVLA
jgi:hypothetical protein